VSASADFNLEADFTCRVPLLIELGRSTLNFEGRMPAGWILDDVLLVTAPYCNSKDQDSF
jgi:hypothetical protein